MRRRTPPIESPRIEGHVIEGHIIEGHIVEGQVVKGLGKGGDESITETSTSQFSTEDAVGDQFED